MKKALILQGWYQKPDSNWYPWLSKELEKKGYEVYLPDLPTIHTDKPSLKKQLAYLDKLLKIDTNTTIIGHSLGCLLAMRIAETRKVGKIIMVAGWDFDDLTKEHSLFWKTKINHAKVKKNAKEIICVTSDNDPYFTAFSVEEMSKRLDAKCVLIKGKGHFSDKYGVKKIPQLLKYI